MTKFELYERLWQDICHKDLFISEKTVFSTDNS